jgi:DNA repair exonuclease SbcCD ATPase subunit
MTTPLQPQVTNLGTDQGAPISITGMPVSPYANYNIQPQGRYFTEEDVERIRKEEKDKMYSRLEKSEQQLNEFKATVESLAADKKARDEELARQQKAAEAEAKRLNDEKLSVQQLMEKQQAEFELKQQQLREDMELRLAIAAKEQQLLQLKSYIQRRINEEVNATTIIPDLVEYIDGTTEEEVEASIQKAKDKTAAIVQAAMGSVPTGPSIPMGTSPTGTPFSPLDNLSPANRELTRSQIEAMSMKEYAAYRDQQGISRAGSGRGLFS